MAISNCSFSPTSENPRGFSALCVPTHRQAGLQSLVITNVSTHSLDRWASCKNVDTQAKSAITHIAFLPAPGLNNIVSNSPDTPKEKSGHFGILQE